MKKVVALGVFLAFAFSLLVSIPVHAQQTGATLTGTVADPSGSVVSGAQVAIKDTATGTTKNVTTDTSGSYSVPNLTPGSYEVRVTATGFSTIVQSGLTLAVGQQQQLNFSMKVGETSTTVQVTEAAPQIDLTSSALTGQVESETVRELPLNGRDWTQLATLQPGVKRIETQMAAATSARGNRGFGGELTVSGQRSTFNNYRIDGISVVDYANAAPGNVAGLVLGVDAIEEFSVLTGGFPAEYGNATGGVINAVSKSGTNTFHGTAYDFLRNSAFDARDFPTRSTNGTKPAFHQNQFGVSAGAPIIKDRTFVFGDYEGLRRTKGIVTPTTTFSNNARLGILARCPNNTSAGCTPPATCPADSALLSPLANICVNNYAAALLPLWPVSTNQVSGDTAQFTQPASQVLPENFYTVRVDHKLGNSDTLFGTYLFDDTDYKQPDGFLDVNTDSHTRRQTIAIEENHTFGPSFVNTVRVGYNRDHVLNLFTPSAINPVAGNKALGFIANQYPARMSIGGGITDFFGGINAGSHYLHVWNSYQYGDDAFFTHGAHTFKFGGSVNREVYNEHTFQEPGGRIKFQGDSTGVIPAGPEGFLTGQPTYYEASLPAVDFPREFRQTIFGLYAQDDWKFKSNLTINVGLRYEPSTVLNDAQGRITNLPTITSSFPVCGAQFTDPIPSPPIQPGSTCSGTGQYYSNATLRNFAPRLGFAWDPFKNGKSSVRGSVGIYDVDPIPGYFLLQQNQAAPFLVFANVSGTPLTTEPGFMSPFAPGEGGVQLQTGKAVLAASTVEAHPKRSYVEEWNLTLQHQLTSDMSLTLGYVGSRGVHLMTRGDDGNMAGAPGSPALAQTTPFGYEFPCGFPTPSGTLVPGAVSCTPGTFGGVNGTATTAPGGGASAQLNPNLGTIRYIYWNANANYNGLNVNLDKRFSHGFQFQVAYTFAKSLDDTSQTIAGDTFGNGINSPWWWLPNAFYGPSDFNVAHTLSINGLYDIPTPHSWNGVLKEALGGWELGGIVTWNSGTPTTAIVEGDPLNLGNGGADQFGPTVRLPGCNATNSNEAAYGAYINASCFTFPSVPTASVGSLPYPCAPFPAVTNTATQSYCQNLAPFNVGRNGITGPHFFNTDLSAIKNFPITKISETFKIQFRAEMFNITNHSNFVPGQPDSGNSGSTLFKKSGALIASRPNKISPLASEPREIQFALKLVW